MGTSMAKVGSSDTIIHIRDSLDTSVGRASSPDTSIPLALSKEHHKALGLSSRASSLVSKGMAAISIGQGEHHESQHGVWRGNDGHYQHGQHRY